MFLKLKILLIRKRNLITTFFYFLFGILCILISFFSLSSYWNLNLNLTFNFWFFLEFLSLLLFFGILFSVAGIRKLKTIHDNQKSNSNTIFKIFSIFLIITIIIAAGIYLDYSNNKMRDHGPYLSWIDDSSTTITITWETYYSDPKPVFKWGESSLKLSHVGLIGGTNHHHTVKLKGLKPDSTYFYQIPGFLDKITSFRTSPGDGTRKPFTFFIYGDTREDKPSESELYHEENIEQMELDEDGRFVIQVGDIANRFAENWMEQWDYNFYVIKPLSKHIPFMTVAGNHDWWDKANTPKTGQEYINFFELPKNGPSNDITSYYFTYDNVFIMAIGYDHEESASPKMYDSKVVNWVKNKLSEAKSSGIYDWTIVFFHKPPFSVKIDGSEIEKGHPNIRYWHPIFMELGVDFVFNGHNHHYERVCVGNTAETIESKNITYIITGGGGGGGWLHDTQLETFDSKEDGVNDINYYGRSEVAVKCHEFVRFRVDGTRIELTAMDSKGVIIDNCEFSK